MGVGEVLKSPRSVKVVGVKCLSWRFIPAISEQLILKFMPFLIPHLIFCVVRALVFEIKIPKVEKLILEARSKNNCLGRYYTSNIWAAHFKVHTILYTTFNFHRGASFSFRDKNLKVEKISTASDIMIFYSCSAVRGGTFKQLPMTL